MRCCLFVVMFIALSSATLADEVVLKTGEIIKGKVVSITDGKLNITSDSVGEVKAALEDIVTFSTEEPISIHFKNETIFKEKILAAEEGKIKIGVGPGKDPVVFNITDIDKANPPPVKWKGALSGGASFTRGNTAVDNANFNFEAIRRSEIDRFSFGAFYVATRERDSTTNEFDTSQRRSGGDLKYDLFFLEKVFGYANANIYRDYAADIDLRFIGALGGGWQAYERDDLNLALKAGLSWISENYDEDPENKEYFAGQFGFNFDWTFWEYFQLRSITYYYPALESVGGDIATSDSGIRVSVYGSLFVDFRVLWNWNSKPSAAAEKRQDVSYLLGVGWTF